MAQLDVTLSPHAGAPAVKDGRLVVVVVVLVAPAPRLVVLVVVVPVVIVNR